MNVPGSDAFGLEEPEGGPKSSFRSSLLSAGLMSAFLVVIPAGIALVWGVPWLILPALAISTFLLQAGAAGSGAMGENGVANLLVVTSFGLGYIATEFEVLDHIAYRSSRLSSWVARVSRKAAGIRFLPRFGMLLLLPLMWLPGIGLYGGVVVAWVLRWDRLRSFAVLAAGWMLACGAVYLVVGQILVLLKG